MTLIIPIGSTAPIRLTGLRDTELDATDPAAYPTTVTVVGALYLGSSMTPVPNGSNLVFAYVAGTVGAATAFRAVLLAALTATLLVQTAYILVVTVTDANGNVRVFYEPCAAVQAA